MKTVLAISGSQRKGSFNTALMHAFEAALPQGVTIEHIDFSHIPLYNQDLEAAFPESVTALKDRIKAADAVVIATPEYNRSMPGYLKNMLDWTSRPYGDSAWNKKPVFVMGATGANTGTALAQYDLKKVLLYLNCRVLGQPEVYVSLAHTKFATDPKTFGTDGTLTDEETKSHIAKAAAAFVEFIG